MKAWITKFALTQGIQEIEAIDLDKGIIEMDGAKYRTFYHGEGKEWHRTKEGAIKQAEEMRITKIKSIEKQLNKLNKLKFE